MGAKEVDALLRDYALDVPIEGPPVARPKYSAWAWVTGCSAGGAEPYRGSSLLKAIAFAVREVVRGADCVDIEVRR